MTWIERLQHGAEDFFGNKVANVGPLKLIADWASKRASDPYWTTEGDDDPMRAAALTYGRSPGRNMPEDPEAYMDYLDGMNQYATDNFLWGDRERAILGQPRPGQVLGQQDISSDYVVPEPEMLAPEPDPYANILSLVEGMQPVQDIVLEQDVIDRWVKNAMARAGTLTTNPKEANLMYRYNVTPEVLKENAEYVGEYIRAAMMLAPYYDLPPKTIAAMLMQESGWGGQRFEGNLGGYGFTGSGTPEEDMGIRFPADTIAGQANAYLKKVASDWEGRYRGSRSPQDFHEKGYNTNPEYPNSIMGVYALLDAM